MNQFRHTRIAVAVAAVAFALTAGGAAAYPLEAGNTRTPGTAAHDPQLRQALRDGAATSPEAARAVSGQRDFTSIRSVEPARREIDPADRALLLRQPSSLPTFVPATGGDRFDWADAGVGAVGALGLVLVLAGASVILRRRQISAAAA